VGWALAMFRVWTLNCCWTCAAVSSAGSLARSAVDDIAEPAGHLAPNLDQIIDLEVELPGIGSEINQGGVHDRDIGVPDIQRGIRVGDTVEVFVDETRVNQI